MRNISFFKTTQQIIDRTKTVTRRNGWRFLRVGDRLCAVEKTQGLKAGEKIMKLGIIEVVELRWEPLNTITQKDVVLEGFPDKDPAWFIGLYLSMYPRMRPADLVHRIEFSYVEGLAQGVLL